MEKAKSNPNNKNLLYVLCFIVFLGIIFCINEYYFSAPKYTRTVSSDDKQILYPGEEEAFQYFIAPYNSVTGLNIYCYAKTDDGSSLKIRLYDDYGTTLGEWEFDSKKILENNVCYIPVEDLNLIKGEFYMIDIMAEQGSTVGVYISDSMDYGNCPEDFTGYSIVYQIEYKTFSVNVLIVNILFVLSILLTIILFKKNVKLSVILSTIFFIVSFIFFCETPFSTLYDEEGHFFRSYEITEGRMLTPKNDEGLGVSYIPERMVTPISEISNSIKRDGAALVYYKQYEMLRYDIDRIAFEVDNKNQALYSPASYIPQAIGIFLGKLATDSSYLIYFYGRFFAFIVNTILVILAINIIPQRKMLVFAIATTPVFLNQSISYSADGTLNAITLFFIAYILMVREKEKVLKKDIAVLAACSFIIALSKVIYFPFVLFLLLVPAEKFKSAKVSKAVKTAIISVSMVLSVFWFIIAQGYVFNGSGALNSGRNDQLHYALSHFYLLPGIVFNTIYVNIEGWLYSLAAGAIGKGWIGYDAVIYLIFIMILVFAFVYSDANEVKDGYYNLTKKNKAAIWIVLILIMALTFGSLYTQWTDYKANTISGVQGRYFIPLLIPLSLVVKPKLIEGVSDKKRIIIISFILFGLLCASLNSISIMM